MSSLKPPALSSSPWGSWSLDYQFLSDLNSWTAENPANNTLRAVLESISEAIEGGKPFLGLIPASPFPAQALATALGTLIQFGAKFAQAKQEVRIFAQDTVEWISRIADAFRDGEVGRFVAKSWTNLQSMMILIDEICAWAAKRLADGRWKRFLRGAAVDHEIRQFKEDLAKTTECFKTLSTIHLAQGQDLVLRNVSTIHSLIEGLKNEVNDLDDAFGPVIAENSTFVAQKKEFCDSTTRSEILRDIHTWALDLAESSPRFLWLSGMPGSGKSVITATVAKMFDEEEILGAQFFISRTQAYEPTTNPNALFPTIAKQLSAFHKVALLSIQKAVKADRSILLQISDSQANGLFVNPIAAICETNPSTPVVIVIDALDEWNANYPRDVNPTDILLEAIRQLPSNAKVLISSRHEDPIIATFSRFNPFQAIYLDTSSATSLRDVENYMKDNLGDIVREFGEDWTGWPTESQVQGLSDQAAGHFTWASTAIKFIRFRIKTDGLECRNDIFDDLRLGTRSLDELYSAILNRCIPNTDPSWSFERFRRIVGALIVLRSPLNIATFGDLLDLKKTPNGRRVDIIHFFKMFQSLLSAGPEVITSHSVPRLHSSFVNFITRAASHQFRIDEKASNKELATRCIKLLKELNIPSSHWSVNPLGEVSEIPADLAYACQFWADHLTAADSTLVLSEVQTTLESTFLYWLEVMSATDRVPGTGLLEAIHLLQHNSPSDYLTSVGATLTALTWIFEKYDSASAALPLRVTMYMKNLIEYAILFRRLWRCGLLRLAI
ncbi:hypothetical protein DFH09DRAFT_81935 [Mycena vulgaris]|nr:hypothetical protein DFH09DRAFT_81935 [Mycena vulgaris]